MEPSEAGTSDSELKSNLFRSLDLQENPQKFSIDSIEVIPEIHIEANITTNVSANTTRLDDLPDNSRTTIHFSESGDLVHYGKDKHSRTHSTVRRRSVERADLPYLENPRDCFYYAASDVDYALVEYDNKEYVVSVGFQKVGVGEFMSPLLDDQNILFTERYYGSLQSQLKEYLEFTTGRVTSSSSGQYFRPESGLVNLTGLQKTVLNLSIPIGVGISVALGTGIGFFGTIGIVLALLVLLFLLIPTRENRRDIQIGSSVENTAPISEVGSIDASNALDLMIHKETVDEVREHNQQLPIDATVEISADKIELVDKEESIGSVPVWNLETDSDGTYNENVVEFFKYIGFEKDLEGSEIETQIFPTDTFIDDSVPSLKSSSRDGWYLVPEPIDTPNEREIPEEPTLSQEEVTEQLDDPETKNDRLLSVAEADHL